MDDKSHEHTVPYAGIAALMNRVNTASFDNAALCNVSKAARVRNFVAFFFPDAYRGEPVMSLWSGEISDYRFRHNARLLLGDPLLVTEYRHQIMGAPEDVVRIRYWSPPEGDPRFAMYRNVNLHGQVDTASRSGVSGLQCFFLHDLADGEFSTTERAHLTEILPSVHSLIFLRHKLVGTNAVRFTPGRDASSLRARGLEGFVALSPAEAKACDEIAQGHAVAETARRWGLSVNSVRTLRQRAYRKLGVHSAGEVSALIRGQLR